MIHHEQLNSIRKQKRINDFIYPYYEGYSIAEIVPSVLQSFNVPTRRKPFAFSSLLGEKKFKKVVLLLVDGFAYTHFIKHYKQLDLLKIVGGKGSVYPITSVFPSTTPAALTCIHTGLTPQEHGLPEMTVFFEEFENIILTLPFKTWHMHERDGLMKIGGSPSMLYEGETVYSQLAQAGIPSYNFIFFEYAGTVYSQSVHRGSQLIPFSDERDLATKLSETLTRDNNPGYYFVYWGNIDAVAHQFGPDSPEHIGAVEGFFRNFYDTLKSSLKGKNTDDVLFLLSADHGHADIRREDIINLNKYSILEKNFQLSTKNKQKILPTGSPHDVFLFIDPHKVAETVMFLKFELVGKSEVISIAEAVERGMFGINRPTGKFLKRVGNVIILPYDGYHVWYEFFPDAPFGQKGVHGGLSEQEMVVPFGVIPMSELMS